MKLFAVALQRTEAWHGRAIPRYRVTLTQPERQDLQRRNVAKVADWQFTTAAARVKLRKVSPTLDG